MASAAPQLGDSAPPQWRRVLIAVPPAGLGEQLARMRGWLDQHCGPCGWAMAPAGTGGIINDALAFYFADQRAAHAFIARFSCGYRTPPQRAL